MKRDIKSIFVSFTVLVLTFSISFNSVFADNTLINIIGAMDSGITDSINWLGSSAINNCIAFELDSSDQRTGKSTSINISSANVTTNIPYKHAMVHLQTKGFDLSTSSSISDDLRYSNIVVVKITPSTMSNSIWSYIYNVGVYTSSNYSIVDAYACMRSTNVIYVFYVMRQGDAVSSLQFNLEFMYNVNDSNQSYTSVPFGFANLNINVGAAPYVSSTYSLLYLLNRLIYIQEHGESADISSISADLDSLLLLLSDVKTNSDEIVTLCNSLTVKADTIVTHLQRIESGLYDPTDDQSWLSKIFDKLVNSDTSSTTSIDIDNTTSKLDELDNSVDLELINNNINNNISSVSAPSTNNFKESLNSFVWLKEYSQNTFNSLSGSAVNLDRFKILYSVPIVILLLCLLI